MSRCARLSIASAFFVSLVILNPSIGFAGPAPSITALSPNSGAVGATVTITGKNFGTSQGASSVKFSGVSASSITSWSSSSIAAVVPTGASTGSVVVTVGGIASNAVAFTVVPAPLISALTPATGLIGASITLTGSNFGTSQGSVTFNGTSASISSWTTSSITAIVPNGATSGNVVVFASGVNSNGLQFTVLPTISGISPGYGLPGSLQTITGSNFGSSQGSGTVTLNGVLAAVTSWSATSISITIPNGAISGNITVQANSLTSNAMPFWVGSLSQPVYHFHQDGTYSTAGPNTPSKTYQSVNLNGNSSGKAAVTTFGTNMQLLGKLLNPTTISFSIWMNESASVSGLFPLVQFLVHNAFENTTTNYCQVQGSNALTTTWTKYTLTCSSPGFTLTRLQDNMQVAVSVAWTAGHSISSNVQAQVSVDGVLNGNYDSTLTIPELLAPGIGSISPNPTPVGSTVTVAGNAFGSTQGTSTITFNEIPVNVLSWSDSTISAVVPSNATSGPVVVTTPTRASNAFLFTISPQISAISPGAGATGTPVTISGSGFGASQDATSGLNDPFVGLPLTNRISFNGIEAQVTSWSASTITALVPALATTGPVVVSVNGTASNSISFTVAPTLFTIAPNSGRPGTAVSVSGINLGASQGSSTVAFNGIPASPTSWSDTGIVVPVPTGATTGPVTVSISGILSNGLPFTIGNGTISGIVSQAGSGVPVANATVKVLQTKSVVGTAVTAQDGSYTVGNLAQASYDVLATASGVGSVLSQGDTVTAGSTTTVNLALSPPGTLSGQVTGTDGSTPISEASVNVLQSGDLIASTTADQSGNYTINGVGPGSYTAQASASGYQSNVQSGVTISSGNTTTADFALPLQKAITYTYDAIGRLIGAVDPSGNTVVYNYDPVGNIQSINEYASSQISIIGFSPSSGQVGAAVTISGSGFSTSAGQNSVSFNGTAANVISATATQIVAIVPTGATTGLISVTSPQGTAASTSPFTVTQ